MHTMTTEIETEAASQNLQKLCRHWSHKFNVAFTAREGRITFPGERFCEMLAEGKSLFLRVDGPSLEAAREIADVVMRHLERFAFRETLADPVWVEN